jgi:hypothetical protein
MKENVALRQQEIKFKYAYLTLIFMELYLEQIIKLALYLEGL